MRFIELAILLGILLADFLRTVKWLRLAGAGTPTPSKYWTAGRIFGAALRLAISAVFVVAALLGHGWGHIGTVGVLTLHLLGPCHEFAVGFMNGFAPGSQYTHPRLTAGAGFGFLVMAVGATILVFSDSVANPPVYPMIAVALSVGIVFSLLGRLWFVRRPFAATDPSIHTARPTE